MKIKKIKRGYSNRKNLNYVTVTLILKLKLKLTPFDIVHHSKGNPFQVQLTVSTMWFYRR